MKHCQVFTAFKRDDYTQILALNTKKGRSTFLYYLYFLTHFYALFMI